MANVLRSNVNFALVGDGVALSCKVDLSAYPISEDLHGVIPDNVTLESANLGSISCTFRGSVITFTLPSAIPIDQEYSFQATLEFEV